MVDKGVSWNVGKVFFQDELVYTFNLLPESGHRRPAFINLQQYYAEGFLYDYALGQPNLEMRWKHKVVGVEPSDECVAVTVETPDGTVEGSFPDLISPHQPFIDMQSIAHATADPWYIAAMR